VAYIPPPRRRSYEPEKKDSFKNRRAKNNWFYKSPAWRSLRAEKLTLNPFCECEECKTSLMPYGANMVDHIQRINPANPYDTEGGQWGEPLDMDNLQSMYSRHHNRKSGKESHGYKQSKQKNNDNSFDPYKYID